jgi:putative oxidoreductase
MKEDGRIIAFSAGILFLRLALGIVLTARGALILFNWWTGQGMAAYSTYLDLNGINFFVGADIWAWVIGLVQFVGGILLLFGLLTRLSALLNVIILLVLMGVTEWASGYFIVLYGLTSNGSVDFQGGVEYSLLIAGACFALFLTGAGKYSLDSGFAPKQPKQKVSRKRKEAKAEPKTGE